MRIHNSMQYIPYTYLIGWSRHNLWYYGAQYGNSRKGTANPSNLWVTYFTSSKYVKNVRELYGEPDVVQVRKVFKTRAQTIEWESRVLQRLGAKGRIDFLNKHDSAGIIMDTQTKTRIGDANRGRFKGKTYEEIYGPERAYVLKQLRRNKTLGKNNKGKNNPMFGRKHKDQTKEIQRDIRIKNARRGSDHPSSTEQVRERIRQGHLKRLDRTLPKFTCPHCAKNIGGLMNFQRWHNENCKFKL